jgi:Domain of unknown function (DUF4135)
VKSVRETRTDQPARGSAAERVSHRGAGQAFADSRPQTIAQRQRADAIRSSPLVVAQRSKIGRLFGEAAQLELAPASIVNDEVRPDQTAARTVVRQFASGPVVQRNEATSPAGLQLKSELRVSLGSELVTIAKTNFPNSYWLRWQSTVDDYVNQILDRLITTYGLKNRQLIEQGVRLEAGTLGANSASLLHEITQGIAQLPATMQTSSNKEIVKLALYPAATDRFSSFIEQYIVPHTIAFARTRVVTLMSNLKTVDQRIRDDWGGLKGKFSLTGDVKTIHLTGSDFHNQGQQVAIIESTTGSKLVYKPRTTSPDRALIGEDGVFAALNEISLGTVQLPTMKFDERTAKGGEAYSYVEFKTKITEKTEGEIESYYMRYGQVAVASKLAGVNDLHYENVMSVESGPTVIDAETSFIPYILSAVDFAKTGIKEALTTFKDEQGLVNNSFYTAGEKNKWDLDPLLQQKHAHQFAAYVQSVRRQDLTGEENYLFCFELGIRNMLDLIDKKRAVIIETMLQKIANVHHIRIVPFKTSEFTGMIKSYRDWSEDGQKDRADLTVTDCVKKIKLSLIDKKFSTDTSAFIESTKGIVGKAVEADLSSGDTPILHFDPVRNELTYHGAPIAISKEWSNPRATITKAVNSVGDSDVHKVKAELLG